MPIPDINHRLTMPICFRNSFQNEISFCYDYNSNRISIIDSQCVLKNHKIIAIRKLDSHGRFAVPKEVILALGSENWNDIFIMYQENNILFLEKKA